MNEQRTTQALTAVAEELPRHRLMLVICRYRELDAIRREFEDWQPEGFRLIDHGQMHKSFDGYLLFEWREKPIPRPFLNKLRNDPDIFDYVPITVLASTP
jgi:hypothetical protein